MASTGRSSLKSTLRQSHANYFDNLLDSVATLADGGVMAAGSVLGIGIQAVTATGADGDANTNQFAMGVQKVGAINNRYTVYKNPYMLENDILIGFRGANFLETGAVYAPYVPLIMTPLVYDPKNFTPRKGVMTRYAKKMVRPEFYGKVIVADVNFV